MGPEKTTGSEEKPNAPHPETPPFQVCPDGTKVWMMNLGYLECDEAFLIRGVNTSLHSTKDDSFVNKRRKIPMYALLIDHPHEGVILWEVGSSKVGYSFCSVYSLEYTWWSCTY
jgi:hypothetical protein